MMLRSSLFFPLSEYLYLNNFGYHSFAGKNVHEIVMYSRRVNRGDLGGQRSTLSSKMSSILIWGQRLSDMTIFHSKIKVDVEGQMMSQSTQLEE